MFGILWLQGAMLSVCRAGDLSARLRGPGRAGPGGDGRAALWPAPCVLGADLPLNK